MSKVLDEILEASLLRIKQLQEEKMNLQKMLRATEATMVSYKRRVYQLEEELKKIELSSNP